MAVKGFDSGITVQDPVFAQKKITVSRRCRHSHFVASAWSIFLNPRRTESSTTTLLIRKSSALTVSPRNAVRCAYRQCPVKFPTRPCLEHHAPWDYWDWCSTEGSRLRAASNLPPRFKYSTKHTKCPSGATFTSGSHSAFTGPA